MIPMGLRNGNGSGGQFDFAKNGSSNTEMTMDEVTTLTANISLQDRGITISSSSDLVQLMRREIVELGIEGNLLFHSAPRDYPGVFNALESHALNSYEDGMNFLYGISDFPQNIKAAIRELTISSHLGNLTAGCVLEIMKEKLGNEFHTNFQARALWDKAIEDGIDAAITFRHCLEQVSMNYGDLKPRYFVVGQFTAQSNTYASGDKF